MELEVLVVHPYRVDQFVEPAFAGIASRTDDNEPFISGQMNHLDGSRLETKIKWTGVTGGPFRHA